MDLTLFLEIQLLTDELGIVDICRKKEMGKQRPVLIDQFSCTYFQVPASASRNPMAAGLKGSTVQKEQTTVPNQGSSAYNIETIAGVP